MSLKRLTIAGILAAALTLTACTGEGPADPTGSPSGTPTPSPTATSITGEAPADEAEAITKAEETIKQVLIVQSEVNAAGGTDASRYDDLATGKGLDYFTRNATRISKGPIANEDGENVEGQAHSEGIIIFEPETAYGQEWEGTANGLVILPGCMDISGYRITTADGKPAYRPDSDRGKVEFQVTYDNDRKLWLISNVIEFSGQTC